MNSIDITLPWPPTVNTYYRNVVLGRRAATIISAGGRAYRKAICDLVLGERVPRGVLTGKLAVKAFAYPPDRRKRDLDNAWKAVLDSLKHAGVIVDDSEIDDLHIIRAGVFNGGRVELRIEEIPGKATTSGALFAEEAA